VFFQNGDEDGNSNDKYDPYAEKIDRESAPVNVKERPVKEEGAEKEKKDP
jgi:hypothetical protein